MHALITATKMNKLCQHTLHRALYFIAIFFWPNSPAFCQADSTPAKFPNLNGTVWVGKDFDGKKYEMTLHQKEGKPAPTTVPKQWIISGTATFVTDPDQKLKECSYSVIGPTGNFAHHPGEEALIYTIQFDWPGGFGRKGVLWPDNYQILMDNVEPLVVGIDYKALFGNDYKGKQWYGEVFNCAGQDVAIRVEFCRDANSVREEFEGALTSTGNEPAPGPKDVGEIRYIQGTPWQPLDICCLTFVRGNVLVQVPQTNVVVKSPEVKKRIEEISKIIDAAIRDADPAVDIIGFPKMLRPK